jgi:hypothetical protein
MYCTLHPEEQATPTEQKHANNMQKKQQWPDAKPETTLQSKEKQKNQALNRNNESETKS